MAQAAEQQIPEIPHAERAGLRALLTHPSFSRLWRAMLVSSLGDWVGFVAVTALVAHRGGTAAKGSLAVAGVLLARLLPSVLFGPFAGVFTDRLDRRKLMITADLARGALYASMPFMPTLWAIFGLSFLIECLSLLWTPAKDASIPNMVPRSQLANANSIGLITTYGTLPLGGLVYTLLAGFAILLGTHVPYFNRHIESPALWLDALTFLFSARMIWGLDLSKGMVAAKLRSAKLPKLSVRSAWEEASEGYRFLVSHPLARSMTRFPFTMTRLRSHHVPAGTVSVPSTEVAFSCAFAQVSIPRSVLRSVALNDRCDLESASPTKTVRPAPSRTQR